MSKELTPESLFNSALIPNNIQISGKSLIEFIINPIDSIPNTDWIFFSSKNSVEFFFAQGFNCDNRKIACIGEGTFKVLSKFITKVDFKGTEVDTNLTGLEFAKILGKSSCLFPISSISNKTIQKHLNAKQVFDCVVYQTSPIKNWQLPYFDILIFTSPSNASNYFINSPIYPKQQIIAMGPSTGNQLEKLGITEQQIPKLSGELGLIDELLKIAFR